MNKLCSVNGCSSKVKSRGYCHNHYEQMRKSGELKTKGKNIKIDFVIDENGCFNCISHSKNSDGYSQMTVKKKTIKIHRFVYEEMFGSIPQGLVIRHKCDNPNCINPEHLETGTHADNMMDMTKRGRAVYVKGSRSGQAKITEQDVREIKRLLHKNKMKQTDIAKVYEISNSTLSAIKYGITWKHVDLNSGGV